MPPTTDPKKTPQHADLVAAHTPERIRHRLAAPTSQSYLRAGVYGAIDGTLTTIAVVSCVAGACLSTGDGQSYRRWIQHGRQ